MRILIMGPPGSGKGTQAAILSRETGAVKISTGDILRDAGAAGTEFGRKAMGLMDRGELVPDGLMLDLIRDRLGTGTFENGWILDGFPRTVAQAEGLSEVLEGLGQEIDAVLSIEVGSEEILRRLLQRVEIRDGVEIRRSDDNEETVRRRIEIYERETRPVLELYRSNGLLHEIEGERPIEAVTASLVHALDEHDHS